MMPRDDNKLSDDEDFDETDGPRITSFETSTSTSGQKPSMEQTQEYIAKLENAVKGGDVSIATEMAKVLADMQAPIYVRTDNGSSKSGFINVTIIVEDKTGQKRTVVWKLQPSVSVFALKWKMYERFGYPPDEQQWIIGKILAEDSNKLSDCGIRTSDSLIIVYLLTRAHHDSLLSSEVEVGTLSRQLSSVGQTTCVSGGSLSEDRLLHPTPVKSTDIFPPLQPARPSIITTLTSAQNKQVGWSCPQCTFFNEPTRPGCEICTFDRPASYRIPADYTPTEREQRRLLEEQQLDQLLTTETTRVSERTWSSISSLDEPLNLIFTGDERMLTDEELATQLQRQEEILSRVRPNGRRLETDTTHYLWRDG